MNEKLMKAGFWLALVAMTYLIVILLISGTPLNLATWALWLLIDFALIMSLAKAKKPYALMVAYTAGTSIIATLALYNFVTGKTPFFWGTTETLAVVAVVAALVVWKLMTHDMGVIMTNLAMVIAGIRTWIDAYHRPEEVSILFWSLSVSACVITYVGSQKKFLDRFMPMCGTVSNGIIIALSLRQFI